MITKILKVKNVGKLNIPIGNQSNDENRNADYDFSCNTIIFGDNTVGKTTLVSIFKSLAKNDKSLIDKRKSFNSNNNIDIKIRYKDGQNTKDHVYSGPSWKNNNIIVFDNDFIADYVFSEDQIKGEHLKSLPKILIGDNVRSDHESTQLMADCQGDDCGECEKCLSSAIVSHKNTLDKGYDFDELIKIVSEVSDAEEQLHLIEKNLKINNDLSNYKMKISNSIVWKLDLEGFEEVFNKKPDSAFESAIELHIQNNTNQSANAKDFLERGLGLIKDDKCPFCAKKLDDVQDLINNLKKYFNQEFKALKDDVKNYNSQLSHLNSQDIIILLNDIGLEGLVSEWSKEEIGVAIDDIKQKSNSKSQDLSYEFFPSSDNNFQNIKQLVKKTKIQLQIVLDKQELNYQQKDELEKRISNLKLNKYRYSEEGKRFYEKWHDLNDKLNHVKQEKALAQSNLKARVDDVFRQNLDNINQFLKELHADFKIEKMKPTIDNRSIDSLKLGEYVFEFTDINNQTSQVEKEQFKETFSDSDKRLLGFAFFLSILKNDDELENKIIILDDPFSSFDANRKSETANLFASIKNNQGKSPKQKIVLTHEKRFYCKLNEVMPNCKLLRLNCSSNNHGSMFEKVDINKFKADQYYADIDYIIQAINSNNNLDEALPKARVCLEYLLKAKYIEVLKNHRDSNNNPINFNTDSINKFLEAIGNQCPEKSNLERLELHRFHHNRERVLSGMTDTEKSNILKKFMELIKKV